VGLWGYLAGDVVGLALLLGSIAVELVVEGGSDFRINPLWCWSGVGFWVVLIYPYGGAVTLAYSRVC
jgi:hypothetical protein